MRLLVQVCILFIGQIESDEKELDAEDLWDRALQLVDSGALDDAARCFAEAAEEFVAEQDHAKAIQSWGKQFDLWRNTHPSKVLETAKKALAQLHRQHGVQDHPDIARWRFNMGYCLVSMNRPAEALEEYERSLAIRQRLYPEGHREIATTLNNAAFCLEFLGRSTEALAYHELALAIRRRLHERDHPEIAMSLNNLSASLGSLGRFSEALPLLKESLAMRRRIHNGPHTNIATSLNNLAFCLADLGRESEALEMHETALSMQRKLHVSDHPHVAMSLSNVGNCLVGLGRATEAKAKLEEAVAILRRLGRKSLRRLAQCLNNQANCLAHSLGLPGEALPIYEETLSIQRRIYKADHLETSTSLENLGTCLLLLGRPSEALPHLKASMGMRNRLLGSDHPLVAGNLHNLSACYTSLGRSSDAIACANLALRMLKRLFPGDHPDTAKTLGRLGLVLKEAGGRSASLERHHEALEMNKRLFVGDHPSVASNLANIASDLRALGQPHEALKKQQESLAMRRRLYDGGHPDIVHGLHELALILERLGQVSEARDEYVAAIEMGRKWAPSDVYIVGTNLGNLYLEEQAFEEAQLCFQEAIQCIEEMRDQAVNLDELDRSTLFGYLQKHDPFSGMIDAQLALANPEEALNYAERGRGRAILDLMKRSHIDPLREARAAAVKRGDADEVLRLDQVDEQVAEGQKRVSEVRYRLSNLDGRSDIDRREIDHVRAELEAQLTLEYASHRDALHARMHLVRSHIPLADSVSASELQLHLSSEECALYYAFREDSGVLFYVPPGDAEVTAFRLQLGLRDLGMLVDEILTQIERRQPFSRGGRLAGSSVRDSMTSLSHTLFCRIIPDAVWEKMKAVKLAYVVPDAALHRIPLEMLVVAPPQGEEGSRYWLDDGPPIAYAPSASVLLESRRLLRLKAESSCRYRALVLADPVFGASNSDSEVPQDGAVVLSVGSESRGEEAGLEQWDVILSYGGELIGDDRDLQDAQASLESAGLGGTSEVSIELWRKGKGELEAFVEVGDLGIALAQGKAGDLWNRLGPGDERFWGSSLRFSPGGLPRLPGTAKEAAAIYQAFTGKEYLAPHAELDDVRVLLGADATERALFENAPQSKILHLATHYIVDETQLASLSALALAMPRTYRDGDDGFLTVSDLLESWRQRLSGCELAVLSACETNRGPLQRSDGMFGMTWGFLYAGVPSMIVSQWRVDDQSTADLMSEFYRHLATAEEDSRLVALNRARKALRRSEAYSHPFYWAPFVFIGHP